MPNLLLQDAIILGHILKESNPNIWISPDGERGCGIGGALLAAGVTAEQFWSEAGTGSTSEIVAAPCIRSRWPWLTEENLYEISDLYREVHYGTRPIEDVAAYVKTIEPAAAPTLYSEPEMAVA